MSLMQASTKKRKKIEKSNFFERVNNNIFRTECSVLNEIEQHLRISLPFLSYF